jgi:membrane-bound lytic murein transglycosylase D
MFRNVSKGYGFVVLIAVLVIVFLFVHSKDRAGEVKLQQEDTVALHWKMPPLPKQLTFAGEKVPLERSEVMEYFNRNFTAIYFTTATVLNTMKQAGRWFPLLEERLKQNGVPDDFKYVCVAESMLQNLISKAGAVGFWQFMNYTSPGYNMEVNNYVDERYNVKKSTDGACIYFKQSYKMFESWTAAAASYNCGVGRYREMANFQGTNNYYDLHLPEETNHYIFRILTYKYIFENARALGFDLESDQVFTPYRTKTVKVDHTIDNLAEFAKNNGTNYKILRLLNPWMKGKSLPVSAGRSYEVLVPGE